MSAKPVQPNQSLLEGIDLLLEVARRGHPVRVRPLARELKMTPTRLQRYLATLAHAGLLQQYSDASYAVGPGIHGLSAVALSASGLAARALEGLPSLSDLGCTVALGVLWRNKVSYLYFNEPGHPIAHALGHTDGYPAEKSVIGLILLAQRTDEQLRSDLPTEPDSCLPLIRQVRNMGYAKLARPKGETGLAVVVGSPAIAGLAVTGHIQDESLVLSRLRDAAHHLTHQESL